MKHSKTRVSAEGFTLIELMITIAIVAILVALAVPAYKDYTIRSKIGECVNNASVPKISISEYWQTLGAWPLNLEEAGLDGSGISHYCTGLSDYQSANGAFTIDVNESTVDPGLATIAPVLTPTPTTSGIINWKCSRGITSLEDIKYLPATCRGT